jgi:hypothetical protein
MKIHRGAGLALALVLTAPAVAQDTALTRSEVTAIRAKLVAVQQAMGEPAGYLKESEDFNLPTDFNPNTSQGGKFWPITSSISMRFTDRAAAEGTANAEKAAEEFQAKYAAAIASGDGTAIERMLAEMQSIQAAALASATATRKDPLQVYVQFNMNPTVGIDPEAVVLEQEGVIALRQKELNSDTGQVTVYLDPVALKAPGDLARFELRTDQNGVGNKTGLYHIVIQANGSVPDIESWIGDFDYAAMLAVFDAR